MGCASGSDISPAQRVSKADDAHSGIWDTSFREVEVRGNEGRYLNVWGNLFDLKWHSTTHLSGRFRNVDLSNKTGVFEWFFDDDSRGAFTGHWKWDGDGAWQRHPWNGQKKGVTAAPIHRKPCKEALRAAIGSGVPLWNRGDYEGCAKAYKAAAETYATEDERLADALRQGRNAPLDSSANSLGWILRRAFDKILSDVGDAKEAPKDCKQALQAAISTGVPLWNRGDYKGCTELYERVAKAYATQDPRLADALHRGQHAPRDSPAQDSLGWILRHAFDAVLNDKAAPLVKTPSKKNVSIRDHQELEQASPEEIAAIQQLFDETFQKKRTRDRDGKLPTRFVVVQAQKNTNSGMLANYESSRLEIKRRRAGNDAGNGDPDEHTTFCSKTCIEGNLLADRLDQDCSEAYLFHGTNPEATLNIATNDFRLEVAGRNRGIMFGPGIYLAESCSKADEYSNDGDSALYKGIFAMLLCRTTLGKACFVEAPGDYQSKVTSGDYDCVIGDREKAVGTYREVVLFSVQQVFPEYAVLYRREMES